MEASRKMGTKFGRPEALTAKDKEIAITMFNGGATKGSIAQHFHDLDFQKSTRSNRKVQARASFGAANHTS